MHMYIFSHMYISYISYIICVYIYIYAYTPIPPTLCLCVLNLPIPPTPLGQTNPGFHGSQVFNQTRKNGMTELAKCVPRGVRLVGWLEHIRWAKQKICFGHWYLAEHIQYKYWGGTYLVEYVDVFFGICDRCFAKCDPKRFSLKWWRKRVMNPMVPSKSP